METNEALVARVIEAEQSHPLPADPGLLWNGLCAGRIEVYSGFSTPDRHYFVFRAAARGQRVEGRKRRIIEGALEAFPQKVLSFDLGVSNSTVATSLKDCLRSFGVGCLPSRVPLLLLMLGQASREGKQLHGGSGSSFEWQGELLRSVSASRPEASFRQVLPPAEFQALSLLIDGNSHKRIAALRQRSPRTIANQLSSAFQRLGVSGRTGVLRRLVQPMALPSSPA